MKLQQIKIIDPETLETKIMNVPCEQHEKILCTEPYVMQDYKRYNLGNPKSYESVAEFESIRGTQLVRDAVIEADDNRYRVAPNAKYDYFINRSDESDEVATTIANGSYKMPISVSSGKSVSVSISGGLREHVKQDILSSITTTNRSAYNCTVMRCTSEGYVVSIQGVECYMPGGAASLYKLKDYQSIVGKKMVVVPVAYNKIKDSIVVSHVEYINSIKSNVINEILSTCEGKKFKGVVTLKKHNYVLVTFNEFITGKLAYDDMDDETKRMFMDDEFKLAETEIEFYIDFENNNMITLTQTFHTRELWNSTIREQFTAGMVTRGTVSNVTTHGVLVKLQYNVISSMKRHVNDTREFKNGDTVSVRIKDIDYDKRLISIAIINENKFNQQKQGNNVAQ